MTRSRAVGMLAGIVAVVAAGLMLDLRLVPREANGDKPIRDFGYRTWFVAPWGTDQIGDGQDPGTPWRTVDYALRLSTEPEAGDTIYCMDGTWLAPDSPTNLLPRSQLQGSYEQPTVVQSWRGARVVFDGTGHEGLNKGAFFLQNRGGFRFKGLTFLNYFDEDTTNNNSTAVIYQSLQTPASLDTVIGVDIVSCTFTVDDRGSMGTLGRGRQAISFFSSTTDPADDVIDRPFVENNVITRCGDHAIRFNAFTPYASIQGNRIESELRFNVSQPDGPDAITVEKMTNGLTISRNTMSGFDHGMNLRGHGGTVRENRIFNMNDDGIFLTDASGAPTGWVFEQNQIRNVGDEGVELRGLNGVFRKNTMWRWNDIGIAFSGSVGNTDGWRVFDNIFADACVCNPDEGVQQPDYTNLSAQVGTSMLFDNNIYYDPQGAFFNDQRSGGIGVNQTFAQWQAGGFDPNGFESSPVFGDTLATPPNLHPRTTGPAIASSMFGGTIGSLPCLDCLWWVVPTTSAIDSVEVLTLDEDRTWRNAVSDGAVFKYGNTFVFDESLTLEPDRTVQLTAHWTLHTAAKDNPQTATQTILPPQSGGSADIDYATVADSVWNPTSAAHRWRTIHRADSTAWNQGSGAFLGDIVTRDAGTFGRVPYASVRVFADPTRLLAIGNLTTAPNGTRGYAYEPNQTYYFTGWASGYQTTDVQYKPQSDGFVFNIDLNSIDVPITTNPQLCTVTISTVDFQGVPTDSILVEANFDGQGANTGDLILSYSSVDCTTDSGGFCGVDLVRSSEISTPDRIKTYTFTMTDTRQPVQFTPITFRGITIPDQTNANLADLVP